MFPTSVVLLLFTMIIISCHLTTAAPQQPAEFPDPQLPYPYNALEPHMDEATMRVHSTGHHVTYAQKTKAALRGLIHDPNSPAQVKSLASEALVTGNVEKLLDNVSGGGDRTIRMTLHNNGGGLLNHNQFFGQMAKPAAGGGLNEPHSKLAARINKYFNSFTEFKDRFTLAANNLFGSGFVFLVLNKQTKALEIMTLGNQDRPNYESHVVLMCLDVWEHAYYLKHQNKRAAYVEAFWKVIDWQYVEKALLAAAGGEEEL